MELCEPKVPKADAEKAAVQAALLCGDEDACLYPVRGCAQVRTDWLNFAG